VRTLTAVSVPHQVAFATALASDDDQRRRSSYITTFRQEGVAEAALLADGAAGLRGLFGASGLPAEVAAPIDDYVAVLAQPGALTAALNWYRALSLGLSALPGPIGVPTLFVWSDGDVAIGRVAAEACAAHATGPYQFEELTGVSHWIPEQAPAVLTGLVLAHLAAFPKARPSLRT
ncbi:MAG: alpha/beta fold hydrolase, partial [Acidimicrobiales bacterium]